jgi:hypothetical protein
MKTVEFLPDKDGFLHETKVSPSVREQKLIIEMVPLADYGRLRRALDAVQALIDESQGVCGLHLNGDIATWEELLQGGRFEGWLLDFSIARAALAGKGE